MVELSSGFSRMDVKILIFVSESLCLFFHRSEAALMQPNYGERKGKDFFLNKKKI